MDSYFDFLQYHYGIEIALETHDLDPSDGYIEHTKPGDKIVVRLTTGYIIETITIALRIPQGELPPRGHTVAKWWHEKQDSCTIDFTLDANGIIKPPVNCFYIFKSDLKGAFSVCQVSISNQGDSNFLRVQELHSSQAYNDNGIFIIPDEKFHAWWSWATTIIAHMRKVSKLPKYEGQVITPDEVSTSDLGSNQARVIWWNDSRNLGQAITANGRIYGIRYKECITSSDEFLTFEPGQVINYRGIQHNRLQGITPA